MQNRVLYLISGVFFYLIVLYFWNTKKFRSLDDVPLQKEKIIPKEEESITFFVIGDWGIDTGERKLVAKQFTKYLESEKPSFVINAGDNYYTYGISNSDDSYKIEDFLKDYGNASNIPWYSIVGNHDCRGSVQAQIDLTTKQKDGRWNMPSRYFSIKKENKFEFFFLETCTLACPASTPRDQVSLKFGATAETECEYFTPKQWRQNSLWFQFPTVDDLQKDRESQLKWLKRKMSTNKDENKWRFVIGHHPIFSSSTRGSSAVLGADLFPILKDQRVDFYISGHDHNMQHLRKEGIDFLVVGGGGYTNVHQIVEKNHLFAKSTHGFLIVNATSNRVHFRMIGVDGNELYSFVREK